VTRFEGDDYCTFLPIKLKLIGPKLSALNLPPHELSETRTGPGQEQKDAGASGRVPLGLSAGEGERPMPML